MLHYYFSFLCFCLNDNAEIPECIDKIVWHDLLGFAKKQSLVGVFFHGMQRLTSGKNKPTDDDVMEWFSCVKQIREKNKMMYEKSALVVKNFNIEGFRCCILKGQGNALMYADPYVRQSGDIDVWVEGGPKKAIEYVRKLCPKSKAVYHHIDFTRMKGVEIEVHYRPSFMNNMIANYRLQRFFMAEAERQFCNKVLLPDNLGEISVPTLRFNRIFQMSHISNHFFHEGIGLRQLVDYYLLLKKGFDEKERKEEEILLKRFGMIKIARAVMYVLQEIFELEEDLLIVKPDQRRGKKLLREIIEGGNFGQYDKRVGNDVSANAFQKNLQRVYRDIRMAMLFPSESLWEPIFRLYHFFWRLYYKM